MGPYGTIQSVADMIKMLTKEIIDIIIAAIIYLSAFALLVQGGIARLLSRKHERAAGKEED